MVAHAPAGAAFVEVGAWLGKSTAYLASKILESGKNITLHVVDTWRGSPGESAHRSELERHGGDLFPAFRENMLRAGVFDLIRPIQKTSVEAAREFADASLDFVYLDASHDATSVTADIRVWWPKIKPGGFIGGHDYGTWDSVTRAVDQLFGAVESIPEADSWLVEKTNERIRRGLPKCVILMPVGGAIEPGCEESLGKLVQRGYPVWRVRGYSAIDAARNQIATDALAQGFDELIWIDSDVVFRPEDVEQLRSRCLPFVCGIYAKKSRREFACAFLPETKQIRFGREGGLTEIRYAGFGFVYTRREVYERIQKKHHLPVCNQRFGSPLVPYFAPFVVNDGSGPWYLSEDYGFCERARQCGIRIVADTTIRLWHVGSYRFSWEDAGSEKERFGDYTFQVRAE